MINRLIEPTSGEILIDGRDVLALDPVQLRRGIGFVMQSGGLFPHRRVADNVATVPRLLGWPADKDCGPRRGAAAARRSRSRNLPSRYPHELSGGERQRVGVARALGADPPILLMDEPFGAVDPIARKRLQVEFKELQKRLNKTVVFVTHDIEEALFLGDRIAIMQRGANLEQFDTPEAILAKPATPFVAEFVGVDRDLQRLAVTKLSLEDVEVAPSASIGTSTADLLDLARSTGTGLVVVLAKDGSPLGRVELAGTESSDLSVLGTGATFQRNVAVRSLPQNRTRPRCSKTMTLRRRHRRRTLRRGPRPRGAPSSDAARLVVVGARSQLAVRWSTRSCSGHRPEQLLFTRDVVDLLDELLLDQEALRHRCWRRVRRAARCCVELGEHARREQCVHRSERLLDRRSVERAPDDRNQVVGRFEVQVVLEDVELVGADDVVGGEELDDLRGAAL